MLGIGPVMAVVAVSTLSTMCLIGVGYHFGWRNAKQVPIRTSCYCQAQVRRMRRTLQRCLNAIDGVSLQTGSLTELVTARSALIPADCQVAIRRLVETAELFTQRLSRATAESEVFADWDLPAPVAETQPASAAPEGAATASDGKALLSLSNDEVALATGVVHRPAAPGRPEIARRYPYDCRQLITPWYGNEPHAATAERALVRCYDLSVEGISFFWPAEPAFERVLVTIGQGADTKLILARVMYAKAVYMHSEFKYLIGCRFVRRVGAGSPDGAEGLAKSGHGEDRDCAEDEAARK